MLHGLGVTVLSPLLFFSQVCSIRDPSTGFVFDLNPLNITQGYVVSGIGKTFLVRLDFFSGEFSFPWGVLELGVLGLPKMGTVAAMWEGTGESRCQGPVR